MSAQMLTAPEIRSGRYYGAPSAGYKSIRTHAGRYWGAPSAGLRAFRVHARCRTFRAHAGSTPQIRCGYRRGA